MPRPLDPHATFLSRYLYACGHSEVPRTYHRWCALSVLAAVAKNHVWVEKFKTKPLFPNLYTILIGPSGLGKGEAIDAAMHITDGLDGLNVFRGKITGAAFAHHNDPDKPRKGEDGRVEFAGKDEQPCTYLITPELSMSVGEGTIALDFIKRMTEWFTGAPGRYQEATLANGHLSMRAPVLNWLGGSTIEWLLDSVPRSAIESGFFARAIPIQAEYDWSPEGRVVNPVYPHDRDEQVKWLQDHLDQITHLEGEVTLSNQAQEVRESWYIHRAPPDDMTLAPNWKRMDDLLLKLACVYWLAEGKWDYVIKSRHISIALKRVEQAHASIPALVRNACGSPETKGALEIGDMIKAAGSITRTALTKKASHKGIDSQGLNRYIQALLDRRQIDKPTRTEKGTTVYTWRKPENVFGNGGE